jgi:hypothetical protein
LQIKNNLYFYETSASLPLSNKAFSQTIDLTTFSPAGAQPPRVSSCQFATGTGKLFVVHPNLNAFYITYDPSDASFTATQIDLMLRDFEGIDDGLDIDERPTTTLASLDVKHHYNLLNQGWTNTNLVAWDTSQTTMPSNADVMWSFKNTSDAFDTTTIPNVVNGNSPATKGHYILNVYNQDRATASGLAVDATTTGTQRASTVAFFAGRVFYAGINAENFNSKIYFSQIIERPEQFGQCYQTNDPTAEDFFDLLPSDGGVLDIQEAGSILKLMPITGGLAVFASNGIWVITGSTGLGFTANDYAIVQASTLPTLSFTSFVDMAGSPVWWSADSINRLDINQGRYVVSSLSNTTIKTYYNTIPVSEKKNAVGFYNPVLGIVQWLFRSVGSSSLEQSREYDRVLNLDLNTQGFYVWTLPTTGQKIHGLVVLESRGGGTDLSNVIDNSSNTILTNDGDNVVAWTLAASVVAPRSNT